MLSSLTWTLLIVANLLIFNVSFAQSSSPNISLLKLNWSCPNQRVGNKSCGTRLDGNCLLKIPESKEVEVKISPDGYNIILTPDFLSTGNTDRILPVPTNLYQQCINRFMSDLSTRLQVMRSSCPTVAAPVSEEKVPKDVIPSYRMGLPPHCRLSDSQLGDHLFNKFNQSYLVSRNRNQIRLVPGHLADSSANLEQELKNGTLDVMDDLDKSFTTNGVTRPVSSHTKAVADFVDSWLTSLSPRDRGLKLGDFALRYSEYLGDYETFKRNCGTEEQCRQKEEVRAMVLSTMNQMAHSIEPNEEKARARFERACGVEIESSATELAAFLKRTVEVSNCTSLQPGQHKLVRPDKYMRSHLLKRDEDGNYNAAFNIDFLYADGSVSGNDMHNRASKCLSAAAPYMKGPNGENFKITILSNEEIANIPEDERPLRTKISVESLGFRANSGAYSQNVPCSTIVHEMLHNFGLCDEYEEKAIDDGKGFSCRVLPKENTVMNQHRDAFIDTIPGQLQCRCDQGCQEKVSNTPTQYRGLIYQNDPTNEIDKFCSKTEAIYDSSPDPDVGKVVSGLNESSNGEFSFYRRSLSFFPGTRPMYLVNKQKKSCKCSSSNSSCLAAKAKLKSIITSGEMPPIKSCPDGMTEIPQVPNPLGMTPPAPDARTGLVGDVLTVVYPAKNKSLLRSNQFKQIISMGCASLNPQYATCRDLAYEKRGTAKCNEEVRRSCENDDYYLGTAY